MWSKMGCMGLVLVACDAQHPDSYADDGIDGARTTGPDTGALALAPMVSTCPDGFVDMGLPHPDGAATCVHPGADVHGTYDAGVVIADGATLGAHAHLNAEVTLEPMAFVAERARIGAGSIIGEGTVVGRRAVVGERSHIGPGSTIGRASTVGDDVDASVGSLTLGYASHLGNRSQVVGPWVMLGNLVSIGADSVLASRVTVARSSVFGDGASLGANTIVGPDVTAGTDFTTGERVRLRKGAVYGDGVTLGDDVTIGRDSVLGDDVTIGAGATLRAQVEVGARGTVAEDAVVLRGVFVQGLPADTVPPVIAGGQTFSVNVPAPAGTVVGTVSASDDSGVIASWTITAGGAGGMDPFFAISPTGVLTLTQSGADSLRGGATALDITVADEGGNSTTASIAVNSVYQFECAGGGQWLGYADLVAGGRVNLCVIYRATATSPDRNTNVFTHPDVVTSCLAPSAFVEPFFRGTNGSTSAYGAVRYEISYTPPLPPGSNITGSEPKRTYHCANATCTSSTLHSTSSYADSDVYVRNVPLCTVSLDGHAIRLTGTLDHLRGSHQQYGSNAVGLYNQNMAGVRSGVATQNLVHYRVMRSRNSDHGSNYHASGGYSFLQRD